MTIVLPSSPAETGIALQMMNVSFKMMNVSFKMMNFSFKMMNLSFKMMNSVPQGPAVWLTSQRTFLHLKMKIFQQKMMIFRLKNDIFFPGATSSPRRTSSRR